MILIKRRTQQFVAILLAVIMLLPLIVASVADAEHDGDTEQGYSEMAEQSDYIAHTGFPEALPPYLNIVVHSHDTVPEANSQRHPRLTADGALLADYLAGELQYLTYDENEYTFYDGKQISFPPSYMPLRPEQQAVLIKGYLPERPLSRIMALSVGSTGDLTNNGRVQHDDTAWPSWGDRYTVSTGGDEFHAFCVNINNAAPGTQSNRPITDISDTVEWRVRRVLWFGRGGPGELSHLGTNNLVVSTTRLIGHFNGTNTLNDPATSASTSIRVLYEAVMGSESIPGRDEWRIFEVSTGSGQQNVIFGDLLPAVPSLGSLRILKTVPSGESAGFQFDVHRVSDNHHIGRYTTNAAGNAYVSDLEPGNYTITEIVPSGWVLESQNPQTVTVVAGVTGTAAPSRTFHNVRQTGGIIIQKVSNNSAFSTHSMEGAIFEIRNSSNAVVATLTTNAAGTATARDLQLGTYTVREITAPTGYLINTTTFNVTLSSTALEVTVTVPQEPQRGRIRIQKQATDLNFAVHNLGSAAFEVRNTTTGALVQTITTNTNGMAESRELPFGTYTVQEVTAPSGYTLNTNTFQVTLSPLNSADLVHWFDVNVPQTPQRGRIAIQKTFPGGDNAFRVHNLAGAVFNVRADHAITRIDGTVIHANNALVATITTDADGWARTADLPLGRYRVYEITAPTGWQINNTVHTLTLSPQEQAVLRHDVTQNHEQRAQRGRIIVEKYISNPYYAVHSMAGAVFNVRTNNAITRPDGTVIFAANALVASITTNTNGRGESVDIPLGSYRVYEITAPYGYALNTTVFNVNLTPVAQSELRRIATQSVPQRAQTGTIDIIKRDHETGDDPQGNASLEGAVFAIYAAEDITRWPTGEIIYRAGQRVPNTAMTVTGNPATARSRELPLGRYNVVEITRPHGYMPDLPHNNGYFGGQLQWPMPWQSPQVENEAPARWPVNITRPNQTVTIGRHSQTVYNHVIQGRIWIIKHGGDDPQGEQQVNRPLEGAIFRVYLTSAGSWENAVALGLPHVEITTNDEGIAYTPYLPYGRYTVHEIYAPGDWTLIPPFERYTTNDPENHRRRWNVIGENIHFEAMVQINKTCTTNSARIAAAGVPFRLFDVDNDRWMSFELNYPTHMQVSVFRTNEQGWLILPERLQSGTYRLYEQAAPYGYVLREEPLEFIVHSAVVDWERDPILIEVNFPNEPVRGQISVEKRGNMFVGADRIETVFGTLNAPLWEERSLPGVAFDVIATEDIVTPCGTVRAYQGQIVDTLVTDENGYAQTKGLFLGRYYVVETETHYGFVLDGTEREVTLRYADQYTPLVFESAEIINVRQKVSIEIEKWMETLDGQEAPYDGVVFGLFAYDDIYSYDGILLIVGEAAEDSEGYGIFARFFNWMRDAFTPEQSSLVATFSVNRNGQAVFSDELPFGRFVIRELQTAEGYHISDEVFPVEFEYAGQEVSVVTIAVNDATPINNRLMRGSLRVTKTFENREEPVAGVPFAIIGDTVVGEIVTIEAETDENGEIILEGLPIGEWTVTELQGDVNTGFILSEAQTVTVTLDELTEVVLHNYLMRGGLRVIKTMEAPDISYDGKLIRNEEPITLAGVPFRFVGDTTVGESVIIETETDENGEIILEDLPIGEWTITELQGEANTDFIISDEQTVTIALDELTEVAIHNHLMRGSLRVIKTMESLGVWSSGEYSLGEALITIEGIPFTIIGNTAVGEIVIIEAETDENGEIILEDLPIGEWTITELQGEANTGFIISDEQTVTVALDELTEVAIHNELMRGSLRVIKTMESLGVWSSGEYSPNEALIAIEGIPFTIIGNTAVGEIVINEAETGENGEILLEGLPIGEWTITELRGEANEGYILSEEQVITVAVDELTEVELHNELMRGDLRIIKTSSTTGQPLQGAEFALYFIHEDNREPERLAEATTDENGIAEFLRLPLGTYKIEEQKAPEGHMLLNDSIEVEVLDIENIIEINIENDPIEEKVPRTGDERRTPIVAMIALAACILAGTTTLGVMHVVKKKRT